jgi:hypothetical protein
MSLKDHPFGVNAFFSKSLVITHAVPVDELRSLLPECLEPDTWKDQWGFVAAAFVDTKALRPAGFPRWMGNDFILAGYRIFVRYTNLQGKRLRGLYILGSSTNKKKMSFFGNIFTHYNYTNTDIAFGISGNTMTVTSKGSNVDVEVIIDQPGIQLPQGSPFADWKEARRFAGPLPFTFTYTPASKKVLIIEGVREDWTPQPAAIIRSEIGFIKEKRFKNIVTANAFVVQNIPYHWKKGKVEIWRP